MLFERISSALSRKTSQPWKQREVRKGLGPVPAYHKLVRDKIPAILRAAGKRYEIRTLEPAEYLVHLNRKLQEELAEYQTGGDVSELADLVEVVHAIVVHKGLTVAEFEAIQAAKREERGGFAQRILLVQAD